MNTANYKHILVSLLLLIAATLSAQPASAQNTVVVIPLFGDDPTPLENIIIVSGEGGDFEDPIAALASIPNSGPDVPSVDNPYLIVIGPGIYPLGSQLLMKPFVSISGSGIDVTILTANISGDSLNGSSAMVVAANQTTLSDLTLRNTSTVANVASIGIYSSTFATIFRHLKIDLDANSATAIGILNGVAIGLIQHLSIDVNATVGSGIGIQNNSSPMTIEHLDLQVIANGSSASGMENRFSVVRMRDAIIRAYASFSSANTDATGILYSDSGGQFFSEFFDGKIIVGGGSAGEGIGILIDGAAPILSHIDIEMFESEDSIGVSTIGTSESKISHCNIQATGTNSATGVSVIGSGALSLLEHCTVAVTRPGISPNSVIAGADASTSGHLVVAHTLFRGAGVFGNGDRDCVYAAVDSGLGVFNQLSSNCSGTL